MPHCPNCGNKVQEEHHYCGQCGYQLASYLDEDEDGIPPSATALGREGFLSGRSVEYLNQLLEGEDLDEDDPGYATLRRDVAAGLRDFAFLVHIDQINLFLLVLDESSNGDVLELDPERLSDPELEERLMWTGFIRIPDLYDRSIGTDFSDNFDETLSELVEWAEEKKEELDKD